MTRALLAIARGLAETLLLILACLFAAVAVLAVILVDATARRAMVARLKARRRARRQA